MDDAELKPSSSQLGSCAKEWVEDEREAGRGRQRERLGRERGEQPRNRIPFLFIPHPRSDMTKWGRDQMRCESYDGATERERCVI